MCNESSTQLLNDYADSSVDGNGEIEKKNEWTNEQVISYLVESLDVSVERMKDLSAQKTLSG